MKWLQGGVCGALVGAAVCLIAYDGSGEVNTATYELLQSWVEDEPDWQTRDWFKFQVGCKMKDGKITSGEFEELSRLRDENRAARIKRGLGGGDGTP